MSADRTPLELAHEFLAVDDHAFQGVVTKLRTTSGSPFALDVMKEGADRIDALTAALRALVAPLAEPEEDILALAMRYIHESLATNGKPEFTFEELQPLVDHVHAKFEDEEGGDAILHVYDSIQAEYTRGHRCSVCGRTAKQNAAIDYNCHNEC